MPKSTPLTYKQTERVQDKLTSIHKGQYLTKDGNVMTREVLADLLYELNILRNEVLDVLRITQ
jgi:hypothetical protein